MSEDPEAYATEAAVETAGHAHDGPVRTATFADHPCGCVAVHRPTPLTVELHHIYPQAEQVKVYGKVRYPILVPLCGTAHNNVHHLIDLMIRGGKPPNNTNHTHLRLARQGRDAIVAGRAGDEAAVKEALGVA